MNTRSALAWSDGAAGALLARDEDHALGWQDAAACASVDPDLFFPEKGGSVAYPKRVCRGCPVRSQCLEFALENDERSGIWGGLSERQRSRLPRAGTPLRRCKSGLHVLTAENTIGRATCRACRRANERVQERRRQELAA